MPDPENKPAEVEAGQPAAGGATAAASTEQAEDRQALRARAIEAERKLAKLEAERKAEAEKRMAEAGEHQKLAQLKAQEAETFRSKWISERRNNALIAAAHKADIKDVSDLVLAKLPDDIDVEDTDALRAAAESVVGELAKAKPYLFGSTEAKTANTSTGKQPPAGGPKPLDLSSIKDPQDLWKLPHEQLARATPAPAGTIGGFFKLPGS